MYVIERVVAGYICGILHDLKKIARKEMNDVSSRLHASHSFPLSSRRGTWNIFADFLQICGISEWENLFKVTFCTGPKSLILELCAIYVLGTVQPLHYPNRFQLLFKKECSW
jgi:hypothetical protein